jgi:hypothetical protein
MNFSARFRTLLPLKRWQRWLLEGSLILAVIFGAQWWQTRGLPEGLAPPLEGMRTDGTRVSVLARTPSAGADAVPRAPTLHQWPAFRRPVRHRNHHTPRWC